MLKIAQTGRPCATLSKVTGDTKWIIGTGAAAIASVAGSAVAVIAVVVTLVGGVREDLRGFRAEMNSRMDSLDAELNSRMDGLDAELNGRMDSLGAELNSRMDSLDARLRNVENALGRVDQRLLTLERILVPPREPAGE